LRSQAGERPNPAEYQSLGIDSSDWPAAEPIETPGRDSFASGDDVPPVAKSVLLGGAPSSTSDLETHLHKRLRFVSLGCVLILAYFSLLIIVNPLEKVSFSLQNGLTIAVHWLALAGCGILATVLWIKPDLHLRQLRAIELGLFGLVTAEASFSLFSDLIWDDELRQPFTQSDHALFHYASSWSLPFFALIVCYGTLIPSTWRRCSKITALMALAPLTISLAAALWEGVPLQSFVESYLLQMAVWMAAAIGIAVYGTRRLEILQREVAEARRLGQYSVKERLGVGGMGEVYLAEHMLLRRPCAIKLIRPELAGNRDALRRFEREVQITATLTHPNTVQVFDYGHTNDGTFYYVMEYLPGPTLDQVVHKDGPLAPKRAVHILRQVCGALREAHAAGLIHRDIKPSNILLCERGGVSDFAKLLDFGLARDLAQARGDQVVAGSPAYMSPEQAAGMGAFDGRTDVYSLGAVAYFLLTGRPPFECNNATDYLVAHIHDPVPPPETIRPEISPDCSAVILRCLEKEPNDRYESVAELDAALADCAVN
jgi:serine/threonine-protein kinase